MLHFKDLPEDVQEVLNGILSLNPSELTTDDKKVLRARRGYLTSDQRAEFAEALEGDLPVVETPVVEETVEEVVEEQEETDGEPQIRKIKKDTYTRDVLAQMAKDAGISVSDDDTKQNITDKLNAYFEENNITV